MVIKMSKRKNSGTRSGDRFIEAGYRIGERANGMTEDGERFICRFTAKGRGRGWFGDINRHRMSALGIKSSGNYSSVLHSSSFDNLPHRLDTNYNAVVGLRRQMVESYLENRNPHEYYEMSFDLTDFGDGRTFEMILEKYNLKYKKVKLGDYEEYNYVWYNDDMAISTNNNPITGEYYAPKRKEREEGFASYMAFYGKPVYLHPLLYDVIEVAPYIKDIGEGYTSVPNEIKNKVK